MECDNRPIEASASANRRGRHLKPRPGPPAALYNLGLTGGSARSEAGHQPSPGSPLGAMLGGPSGKIDPEQLRAALAIESQARIGDPRQWRRYRGVMAEAQGRQRLTAPMPGKVVRLLVAAGDAVEAGQGIVVVEAMKMQNEVRSPKSGTVEALLVTEGEAVDAGETLGYIA